MLGLRLKSEALFCSCGRAFSGGEVGEWGMAFETEGRAFFRVFFCMFVGVFSFGGEEGDGRGGRGGGYGVRCAAPSGLPGLLLPALASRVYR